jgi:hypothetical protein
MQIEPITTGMKIGLKKGRDPKLGDRTSMML